MTAPASGNRIRSVARFLQSHLIWLLLACYVLAACWPAPGVAMREWKLSQSVLSDVSISFPLMLLALLLFSAAAVTQTGRVRAVLRRPWLLIAALVAVWLGPTLVVLVAGQLLPGEMSDGLLVGLALVATMPVANSSVGWSQHARGNLALSLALIVFSISLSPLVTPQLLQLLGLSLSPIEREYCDALVTRFSGRFFIVWVILPTLAGFVCRALLGEARRAQYRDAFTLTSIVALLLLNYANAATALPQVWGGSPASVLLVTILLAVAFSATGMALALVLAQLAGDTPELRAPLLFGLSMKHTGLALVLAGTVLQDEPRAILMIVVATIVQHVMAGIAHRWLTSPEEVGENDAGGNEVDGDT